MIVLTVFAHVMTVQCNTGPHWLILQWKKNMLQRRKEVIQVWN